jgi:hypothetical protein
MTISRAGNHSTAEADDDGAAGWQLDDEGVDVEDERESSVVIR